MRVCDFKAPDQVTAETLSTCVQATPVTTVVNADMVYHVVIGDAASSCAGTAFAYCTPEYSDLSYEVLLSGQARYPLRHCPVCGVATESRKDL